MASGTSDSRVSSAAHSGALHGVRNNPECEEETIFVYTKEVAPPYREIEEKRLSGATHVEEN